MGVGNARPRDRLDRPAGPPWALTASRKPCCQAPCAVASSSAHTRGPSGGLVTELLPLRVLMTLSWTCWGISPGTLFFSSTTLLLPTHLPPPSCTHAQSCNPMDCSPPGSSVHGLFQARILEWVAFPSPYSCSLKTEQYCSYLVYYLIETSDQ